MIAQNKHKIKETYAKYGVVILFFPIVGMALMWRVILHGHYWITMNGVLATLLGLAFSLSIMKMAWKDTPSIQLYGSRNSSSHRRAPQQYIFNI